MDLQAVHQLIKEFLQQAAEIVEGIGDHKAQVSQTQVVKKAFPLASTHRRTVAPAVVPMQYN